MNEYLKAGVIEQANSLFSLPAQMIGSKYQQRLQHQTMDKQYNLNSKAMSHQADLNHGNWVKQFDASNQYNTPEAQKNRMKDAGFNLALMYGKGGLTNTSSMGAGAGAGLAGSSALGTNMPGAMKGNLAGTLLQYQEAQRAPTTDALQKWQAALQYEKTIDLWFSNEENRDLVNYLKATSYGWAWDDKEKRMRVTSVTYGGELGGKEIKRGKGLAAQKVAQLDKTRQETARVESETQVNNIAKEIKSLELELRRLGVNPSNNDTMVTLARKLKDFNMDDREIRSILLAYNVSGEVVKNVLKQLHIGRLGGFLKGAQKKK